MNTAFFQLSFEGPEGLNPEQVINHVLNNWHDCEYKDGIEYFREPGYVAYTSGEALVRSKDDIFTVNYSWNKSENKIPDIEVASVE